MSATWVTPLALVYSRGRNPLGVIGSSYIGENVTSKEAPSSSNLLSGERPCARERENGLAANAEQRRSFVRGQDFVIF